MQKVWSKSVIPALGSGESNLQRHIEDSHRALYFQSRSQRNIVQQCTRVLLDLQEALQQQLDHLCLPVVGFLNQN